MMETTMDYQRRPSFTKFVAVGILLTFLILLAFGMTRWFDVPAGSFVDWLIGIASAWWLLVVVTIPWNVYFQARAIVADAGQSINDAIAVQPAQLAYARRWVKRALGGAIVLHALSAVGLYWVAASGISAVGYASAGAALLLTGLRPALRGYEYVATRLTQIHQEIRYPREDVNLLKAEVEWMKQSVQGLQDTLNAEQSESWAAEQVASHERSRAAIERVQIQLNELSTNNKTEHRQLVRDMEHAVAQISTDGKVLEHARELVRFIKQA
jgi:hypothetical protein